MTPQEQDLASQKFNSWYETQKGTQGLVDIPAGMMEAYGGPNSAEWAVNNGTLTTRAAISSDAANLAGVANGTLKPTQVGNGTAYVPTGSAADKLSSGIASGAVSATNPQAQMAASMEGNNVNAPGIIPIAPPVKTSQPSPNTVNATPFTDVSQGFAAAQASGLQAPQSGGEARMAIEGFMNAAASAPVFYKPRPGEAGYDPKNPDMVYNAQGQGLNKEQYLAQGGKEDWSNIQPGSVPAPSAPTPISGIEQLLAEDPGYQQLLKDRAEYNSVANQSKSLVDIYNQMTKDAGIPALNAELINTKKIIEGTEDDIRNEVKAASGFATDSQVLALAGARNKQLIKNYNALLDTKQMAMEQVSNMVNLAGQDRTFALNAITQKLQIDQQISEYRDKFVNNAKEGYNRIIEAVGYAGLYNSLKADPHSVAVAEKTMGLAPGQLAGLASYVKPPTPMEALQMKKLEAEIGSIPLDDQLRRAQIAKIYSDMNNTGNNNTTAIKDINGVPTIITYDGNGNLVNSVPLQGAKDAAQVQQQQAQSKSNIDLINDILQKANDPKQVGIGANGLRNFLVNPFSSKKADFIAGVQQLTSQLSLDSLIRAKANGATFGALSEGELNILSNSASKFNSWAIKDKNGNVTGYNTSADSFKKELDKIGNFAKLDYILKGGNPADIGAQVQSDGSIWTRNSSGTMEQLMGSAPKTTSFNSAGNASGSTTKTGMRTDRHNNPAAFTTDIAKQAGLVLGVDYTVGDAFPNNPSMRTATLLGNPIAQTIKVIDKIGFYTQSGAPRWSYVSSLSGAGNWKNLSYDQKKKVIAQMYSHEGGSALSKYFA